MNPGEKLQIEDSSNVEGLRYDSHLQALFKTRPWGDLIPYLTVTYLDLIEKCGGDSADINRSDSTYWEDFLNGPN
jgi:hypothetical protein